MQGSTPGITFRESMSGWFSLGSIDPADGQRQGQASRTRLALRLTVTIADVRAFMRDHGRAGTLSGVIDLEPLGRAMAGAGVFNLFSPPGDPDLQLTTYELAFVAHGRPYHLTARKETRSNTGADIWRDTTTVLAALHEGPDAAAPIVGAGVLMLEANDVAQLASSVRVTNAESLGDSTLTLTGFGRFLLGDLWDGHARPERRWKRLRRTLTRPFHRATRS